MAWPRATGPFFPAPGPLAHWPGSLALIGSFAHWLIGTGLASFAWPHLFIASSAPWRWPNWLIGSLALASLAHLLLAHWVLGSGLIFGISRAFLLWPQAPWLLGAHCTICSFAHWLIWASLAPLLNGSLAHWLICAFFGIYRAHLAQASFLAFLELFCSGLRLLGSLALIAPFAHLLIGSFGPLWLLCSMAHWLIGSFVPFLAFIELIWLRPHFWHISSFFAPASGHSCLRAI